MSATRVYVGQGFVQTLLEAMAKAMKHATAMSTILALELFQAQGDAAIASSKIILDHSSHALRNATINFQLLFDKKITGVAKSNPKTQHRFLASFTNNLIMQPLKSSYTATGPVENLDSLQNFLDLNRINHIGLRISHSPVCLIQKKGLLRGVIT